MLHAVFVVVPRLVCLNSGTMELLTVSAGTDASRARGRTRVTVLDWGFATASGSRMHASVVLYVGLCEM